MTNPCDLVRSTCRSWMEQEPLVDEWADQQTHPVGRRSVRIHKECLGSLAKGLMESNEIYWDEENWHYTGDKYTGSEAQRRERVILYILALDAINFCFWPTKDFPGEINKLEYDTLASAMKLLAEQDDNAGDVSGDSYAFSPRRLAAMTEEQMEELLRPHLRSHFLYNMEKRASLWQEVGECLLCHFGGSATRLVESAGGKAPNLVHIISSRLPGFRDVVEDDGHGKEIWFLKRAQIFVGDVDAALGLGLQDMELLTCFADYRVPQILRHYSVLEYSPELSSLVDDGKEIEPSSNHEISIRSATVEAVECLVDFLNEQQEAKGRADRFSAYKVDWYLWQLGEKLNKEGKLKPFHKVRTHFY